MSRDALSLRPLSGSSWLEAGPGREAISYEDWAAPKAPGCRGDAVMTHSPKLPLMPKSIDIGESDAAKKLRVTDIAAEVIPHGVNRQQC